MSELKAEKKRFVKNVSWLFIAHSVPSAVNFLEVMVLARVLGLETFGLLTIVIAYVGIVNLFLDFWVWEFAVKYVGEFLQRKQMGHVLSTIKLSYIVDILTGLVAFFVSIALASLANDIFIKSPDGLDLVLIFSFSLMFSTANTTSEALFRVFDRFRTITFVKSFESTLKLVFVLTALYLGYGIKGVLFAYVVVSFLGFVLRQILVNRMLRESGLDCWFSSKLSLLSNKLKEMSWFLLNTSFNSTLRIASEGRMAVLVLGYFFSGDQAGLYRVARSVIKITNRIADPINETIFPRLISMSTASLYSRFVEIVKYATNNLLKLVIPVSIVILLFAEYFIGLVFGDQYIAASNTMRILMVAALLTASTFWIYPSLLAVGKPELVTVVNIFKTLAYSFLLLGLVPRYSYLGAGISFLCAEILVFLVALYLAYRLNREYLK